MRMESGIAGFAVLKLPFVLPSRRNADLPSPSRYRLGQLGNNRQSPRYNLFSENSPCSSFTASIISDRSASLFAMTTASPAHSPAVPCRFAPSTLCTCSGFRSCHLDSTNAGIALFAVVRLTFTQGPVAHSNGPVLLCWYCWRQSCGLPSLRQIWSSSVGWFVSAHPSVPSSLSFISCARPRVLRSKKSLLPSLLHPTRSVPSAAQHSFSYPLSVLALAAA